MWDRGTKFIVQYSLLCLASVCALLPAIYLLFKSLQINGSATLLQYETVLLYTKEFFVWLWNSTKYTLAILCILIPISVLAGYSFSQFAFRRKRLIFALYFLLMLLPFQATVVSQYITLDTMGLLDSEAAIILPAATGTFGPFLITQYMKGIDSEILQAAKLDGAGSVRILLHIVLPICKPAILSLVILQFINSWSMIDQPLLFLRREELLPLSLELSSQGFGISAFAAGVLYAIPPVLAYLYCRDSLEKGINLSRVK